MTPLSYGLGNLIFRGKGEHRFKKNTTTRSEFDIIFVGNAYLKYERTRGLVGRRPTAACLVVLSGIEAADIFLYAIRQKIGTVVRSEGRKRSWGFATAETRRVCQPRNRVSASKNSV